MAVSLNPEHLPSVRRRLRLKQTDSESQKSAVLETWKSVKSQEIVSPPGSANSTWNMSSGLRSLDRTRGSSATSASDVAFMNLSRGLPNSIPTFGTDEGLSTYLPQLNSSNGYRQGPTNSSLRAEKQQMFDQLQAKYQSVRKDEEEQNRVIHNLRKELHENELLVFNESLQAKNELTELKNCLSAMNLISSNRYRGEITGGRVVSNHREGSGKQEVIHHDTGRVRPRGRYSAAVSETRPERSHLLELLLQAETDLAFQLEMLREHATEEDERLSHYRAKLEQLCAREEMLEQKLALKLERDISRRGRRKKVFGLI